MRVIGSASWCVYDLANNGPRMRQHLVGRIGWSQISKRWMFEHREIFYLFLLLCLLIHLFRKTDIIFVIIFSFLGVVSFFGFIAMLFEPIVYLRDVMLFVAIYGVTLYVVLCELLLRGGAEWLTNKRGEKWVKEMDYFYLAFGLVGILGSVNKIDQISGRFSKADIIAPLVLITAVVIRFIKTRADIAGWGRFSG
jgi:hypothetical protein